MTLDAWSLGLHCHGTWSHGHAMFTLCIVTTVLPFPDDCDKCDSVNQGNSESQPKGVGGVRGKWKSGSKVPQEIFIIFSNDTFTHCDSLPQLTRTSRCDT